jgi:hypothetical protein
MAGKLPTWQEAVVAAAGAVTSFVSAGQALAGMWDVINDPDMSPWEKISSIFSTLATIIPSLMMSWKALTDAKFLDTTATTLNTLAEKANEKAKKKNKDTTKQLADA